MIMIKCFVLNIEHSSNYRLHMQHIVVNSLIHFCSIAARYK